eukprot:jgi/Psemu1/31033/gm1.31033_g
MAEKVKKEDKDIPPAPELPGHVGRVTWIYNERVLDTLIDHKTPGKVLAGAGAVKVMDLKDGFDAKTLKAKAKDLANANMDKATKSDDAVIPEHLWNKKMTEELSQKWSDQPKPPLDVLSQAAFKSARTSQNASIYSEKRAQMPEKLSRMASELVLKQTTAAGGPGIKGSLSSFGGGLLIPPYLDPSIKALVKKKLSIVMNKGYIKLVDMKFVEAMMFMFHILKGEMGVRIVYNGTKSGLNNALLRKHYGVGLSQLLASASDEPDWSCLNLPGMESYDPTEPWISKFQSDGLYTAEITQYMDDIQITDPTADLAWKYSSTMAKGLCWLGLQDSARKQRSPHQEPGAWAGTLPHPEFLDTPPGYKGMGHSPLSTRQVHSTQRRTLTWVSMVSQSKADVIALMELSFADDPPRIPARACNKEACYVIGDTSGSGFGVAANLVESLKHKVGSRTIPRGLEVFMFTDNFVAESTMYKGPSFSESLHNMILELRKMAMNDNIIIHFVWISGDQMIWQGTDGMSRGDFTSGVMAGEAFLKFIPLHLSGFDPHPLLEGIIKGWIPNKRGQSRWKITSPNDWFHMVFTNPGGGGYIAKIALEQLCKVQHVFPTHDMEGPHAWLSANVQCVGIMCYGAWHPECFSQVSGDQFHILLSRDLDNCLVDNKLMENDDTQRFKNPRNRDNLMTPFQYKKWATPPTIYQEWSTVAKKHHKLARYSDFQVHLGTTFLCLPLQGPLLQEDCWGMKVGCAVLLRSLNKGRDVPCVQLEMVRKCRSAFTNYIHTCSEGVETRLTLQGRGCGFVSTSVANSLWFNQFNTRCHRQMGDVWLLDAPVTLEIMDAALDYMEERWKVMEGFIIREMFDFTPCVVMLLSGFNSGLQGEEICRISLSGIRKYWDQSTKMDKEDNTRCTRRNILKWFKRMKDYGEMENIIAGPLFMNEEQNWRATIANLDWPFHDILNVVQRHHTLLIGSRVLVKDVYSTNRHFRRGATSTTQNARLDADTISANNHWRTQTSCSGSRPNSMLNYYSTAKTLGGWWTTSSSTRHQERPIVYVQSPTAVTLPCHSWNWMRILAAIQQDQLEVKEG